MIEYFNITSPIIIRTPDKTGVSKNFEVIEMDKNHKNNSIRCTVTSCENHNATEDYCALDTIMVGTHEPNPSQCQCVDCESFVAKAKCHNC